MKSKMHRLLAAAFLGLSLLSAARGAVVTINGQSPGPSPFISRLSLTVSDAAALDHIDFKVYPKPGSSTRPVYARYSKTYLQGRGLLNPVTGLISLPVFGLYANYSNRVALVSTFVDQSFQRDTVSVPTPVWTDPANAYKNPTVAQPRTPNTNLSYDFLLLKNFASANTPIIIDTDGEVRWVGTAGIATQSALLFENGIYISNGSSGMIRMEFDGTFKTVADFSTYSGLSNGDHVTYTGHHQFDYGKSGIIIDVNTQQWTECVNIEVDGAGNVLHSWNLADIIAAAMTAGGDVASVANFVKSQPNDWFHNNAATYRPSDNSMIMSSRENFVICIDYSTGAIKWILGDPTKQWHQYPSLSQYALTPLGTTVPPIGQHGVSIYRDRLLLFDDGANSQNHTPAGASRSYSVLRKYAVDAVNKTANEIWEYNAGQSIYSPFCSSVYEDGSQSYLANYSNSNPTILMGFDPTGAKVFDYRYPTLAFCGTSWNATPIHLENLRFY